jgi:hypothetical protein
VIAKKRDPPNAVNDSKIYDRMQHAKLDGFKPSSFVQRLDWAKASSG